MKKTAPKKDKKTAPETPAKNRHGGARPGAGRKPKFSTPRNIAYSFGTSKENIERLKKIADFLGKKPQEILNEFIESFDLKN